MSEEPKDSPKEEVKEEVQKELPKLIPVINVDLRSKIKENVPFLEGAWVEFYDDLTVADQKLLQDSDFSKLKKRLDESYDDFDVREKESLSKQSDTGRQLTLNLVSSWNFADEKGNVVEVNLEIFKVLPLKLQRWILKTTTDIIKGLKVEDFDEVKKN